MLFRQTLPVAIAELAATMPGLGLLVLHGSRARGDAHQRSDWDFAYLRAFLVIARNLALRSSAGPATKG